MPSRYLRIREIVQGRSAYLYALQQSGSDAHLLREFFDREGELSCGDDGRQLCSPFYPRCKKSCYRNDYLLDLYNFAYKIGPRRGFIHHRNTGSFARLKIYEYPFGALASGPFRVYGMLLGDPKKPLFVAGGGGIKLCRAFQDDEYLHAHSKLVKSVRPAILRAYDTIGAGIEENALGTLRIPKALLDLNLKIRQK